MSRLLLWSPPHVRFDVDRSWITHCIVSNDETSGAIHNPMVGHGNCALLAGIQNPSAWPYVTGCAEGEAGRSVEGNGVDGEWRRTGVGQRYCVICYFRRGEEQALSSHGDNRSSSPRDTVSCESNSSSSRTTTTRTNISGK